MGDWKGKLKNRTREAVDNRATRGGGRRSVIDLSMIRLPIWEPRAGKDKNYIDIMPWRVSQGWYKKMLGRTGKPTNLDPGDYDYKLEISRHSNIGPNKAHMLCLREVFGKGDPVCEDMFAEYQKRKDNDKSFDKDKARAFQPSWRDFYIVFDYDDPSKGFQLWPDVSYELFEKFLLDELAKAEDGDGKVIPWDLENGRSIEWQGREEKFGNNPYVKLWGDIVFHKRDAYKEEDITKLPSLDEVLIIPTYEEIKAAHYGMEEDEVGGTKEQEEKAEPSAQQGTAGRTRTRSSETAGDAPSAEGKSEALTRSRTRGRGEPEPLPVPKGGPLLNECPAGGTFGADCGMIQACKDEACEQATYELCIKKHQKLATAKGSEKPRETEKKPEGAGTTTRTRRR